MARTALLAALLALAFPAAASAFDAHGSARQVYVTGLTPGAPTSLVKRRRQDRHPRAPTRRAACCSATSSRASGYQVALRAARRPAPLTVLSNAAGAAETPSVYDQSIPSSGYGYLTTRDGTKLAINVHPPQDVARRAARSASRSRRCRSCRTARAPPRR